MRAVLIGVGSIGGPLAVLMHEKGVDLDVVAHGEEKAKLIREEGFKVTGTLGEHVERLNAHASIDELSGTYDVCFIATKYQQMPELAREITLHLNENSLVVSLQNGIVTDLLAKEVGENRTVACMIGIGATLLAPNHVQVTAGNEFIIGMPYRENTPEVYEVAKLMSACCPTAVEDDIIARLYSKVIFNSCINSLAGITGKTVGSILDTKDARRIILAIIREGMAVADKMQLDVPKFNMLPKFGTIAKNNNPISNAFFSNFLRIGFKVASKNVKPSTLQSLEKGNRTEIDIMNGYISAKGKELGIPTPVNDSLTKMIKDIENGNLKIDPENVKRVVFI